MKKSSILSKILMTLLPLTFFTVQLQSARPFSSGIYKIIPFQSSKLAIQLELPDNWQSKLNTEETDNSVVFKYSNPGGQPTFLFSINKISDVDWMKIKDQLSNSGMLLHVGNSIYYYEKTATSSIKGANKDEYKSVISGLDEVIKTVKTL